MKKAIFLFSLFFLLMQIKADCIADIQNTPIISPSVTPVMSIGASPVTTPDATPYTTPNATPVAIEYKNEITSAQEKQNDSDSDVWKIGLTIFGTVVSGVVIFLFNEWFKARFSTPIDQYKKLKARVRSTITLYASEYENPIEASPGVEIPEKYLHASVELRKLASEVYGFIETLYRFHPLIPSRRKLVDAAMKLTYLSNEVKVPFFEGQRSVLFHNIDEADKIIKKTFKFYGD